MAANTASKWTWEDVLETYDWEPDDLSVQRSRLTFGRKGDFGDSPSDANEMKAISAIWLGVFQTLYPEDSDLPWFSKLVDSYRVPLHLFIAAEYSAHGPATPLLREAEQKALDYGIEDMIAAYYAGIPLQDIVPDLDLDHLFDEASG